MLLPDLHTGFSRGRSGGLVFPPLSEEYIIQNAWMDKYQAGIKTARRNINNLRYVDDTTLMAKSKEELKSLLMRVKRESEKVGLELNIPKIKIVVSSLITSWQVNGRKVETVTDFILLGSKITVDGDLSHETKRHSLEESYDNLDSK